MCVNLLLLCSRNCIQQTSRFCFQDSIVSRAVQQEAELFRFPLVASHKTDLLQKSKDKIKPEQQALPWSSRKSSLWNEATSADCTRWLKGNKLGQRLRLRAAQVGFSGGLSIAWISSSFPSWLPPWNLTGLLIGLAWNGASRLKKLLK